MSHCHNRHTLVNTAGLCVDNMKHHANHYVEHVAKPWFDAHLGLVFVIALILIGICAWFSNRSGESSVSRSSDANIDYQLQQINNHLSELRNK